MPKRLFDGLDQGLGEEILFLEGLPPPDRREAYCTIGRALELALGLLGCPLPYATLMGLTGPAFLLPLGDDLAASWEAVAPERLLPEALSDLGILATRHTPGEAEALSICHRELHAGRPLLARCPGGWAVIVGLKGEQLLARVPGSPRNHEPVAPPAVIFTIEAAGAAAPLLTPGLRALRRALPLLDESRARWAAWLQRLDADEPYGPEAGRLERFLAEQYLIATVLDARDAAAQFILALADEADHELSAALLEAASVADGLVNAVEQLLAPPEAIGAAHLPEDLAWLERHRELVEHAGRCDDRLAEAIAKALHVAGDDDATDET